jgi:hypothetical protein
MKPKRGRKSEASSAVALAPQMDLQIHARPEAPYELTEQEANVWRGIVDRLPADWFHAENYPLLVQYCRHTVNSHRIAQLIEQIVTEAGVKGNVFAVKEYTDLLLAQSRETASIARLATKMRICQQSTIARVNADKGVGFKRDWKLR